jgi:tetratricopeptide (TPR) repeat protein
MLHRGAEYFRQASKPRAEWGSWDDLDPVLAEFDLRCLGGEYDTAGERLREFSGDLYNIGHYLPAAGLHVSLLGKLRDPELKQFNLSSLGNLYWKLALFQKGIDCFAEALSLARERKDYSSEGSSLNGLGICYFQLGQTVRAIEYYEQSLAISRKTNVKGSERVYLHNLGDGYASLGLTSKAIEYCEQSIAIAREIPYAYGEAFATATLAEVLIDEGHHNEAIQRAQESVRIGEEINAPTIGSYGGGHLALACLFAGDLSAARDAAETACQYDEPLFKHYCLELLGLIALRQGDRPAALGAFRTAVELVDALLAHTTHNYEALDVKGLALCGLALLEKDPVAARNRVAEASDAYRAARAINADAGVVGRVLRLLDALALADPEGGEILAEAREAAGGDKALKA